MTIVVPVYNEAATLRGALERLIKAELPIAVEILVVDDGSTDGSLATIDDYEANGLIRTFKHPRNLGKGSAVRTGIREANGDLLTIFDADFEYNPADYGPLLEPLLNSETSVAYGTRSFGAHTAFSFWYVIGNRVLTLFASFLFNSWLSDIETCFKVAETEVWRSLELTSAGFGIEAEATAKFLRNGHRIFEVPISYKARSREEGKKLNWTDGVEAFWILILVRALGRRTLFPRRTSH
ncbi:MAG TPA: glycosyltransferase family 2 protein [Actinomycetota bacterium]|nr:glycosyltransferase family 2 protein [Actinomycetota bacterium]